MSAPQRVAEADVVREVFCRALAVPYHDDVDALMAEWEAYKPGFLWWGRALGAFLYKKQREAVQAEREKVLAEVRATERAKVLAECEAIARKVADNPCGGVDVELNCEDAKYIADAIASLRGTQA